MSSSVEVLAPPPPPRRRPVLRAVVTVVALGLVTWGVVARLSSDDQQAPAAAPPAPTPTRSSGGFTPARPVVIPPPPWVRYPTPLEGSWVSVDSPGRVTLVVSNDRLALYEGSQDGPERRTLGYRTITVSGHRLHVRPSTDRSESATYRWRIQRDLLHFDLVEATPKAALGIESVTFHRT